MQRLKSLFVTLSILLSPSLLADTLKVIGIPGAPYRFYNENHQLVGFDVEILDEIMDKLGIKYHIDLLSSPARLTKMWQDPNVDMVFTLSKKAQPLKEMYNQYVI